MKSLRIQKCEKCRCDGFEMYKGNAREQRLADGCRCDCHSSPSLTELLKEFDEEYVDFAATGSKLKHLYVRSWHLPAEANDVRDFITRAFELGVAEARIGQKESRTSEYNFGKRDGVAEERVRILKGLPDEVPEQVGQYYNMGLNKYRQQVLALLEGEKSV